MICSSCNKEFNGDRDKEFYCPDCIKTWKKDKGCEGCIHYAIPYTAIPCSQCRAHWKYEPIPGYWRNKKRLIKGRE